jgi:hypothetical protein
MEKPFPSTTIDRLACDAHFNNVDARVDASWCPAFSERKADSRQATDNAIDSARTPEWRNGRRRGLKIPFPQGSAGSSPASGTNDLNELR